MENESAAEAPEMPVRSTLTPDQVGADENAELRRKLRELGIYTPSTLKTAINPMLGSRI
jgi:hypothetical protein